MFGTGVSPGISIGTAHILRKKGHRASGVRVTGEEGRRQEAILYNAAVDAAVKEISDIRANTSASLQKSELDILDTQIEFLTDPQIRTDVLEKINMEYRTAADSVIEVIDAAVAMFESMDDDYLRERSADIRDIGDRLLKHLLPDTGDRLDRLPENTILVADDITPSDIISLDISRITGIATRKGGTTSHTAIIARSRGIPAVVACGEGLSVISRNDRIVLDGSTGELIINPDGETEKACRLRQQQFNREKDLLQSLKDKPAVTTDGQRINLYGNIAGPADLGRLQASGGEGVGLLRTELLFLDRETMPDEDEQFEFYREVAEKAKGKPVIVRTLDIGGDKQLPYLAIPSEANPFMGYRAIRLSLDRRDIFLTQLRAILRAAKYGDLRLMFPMISTVAEVRSARECIRQAEADLRKGGFDFREKIVTGIMIEIPAAALIADRLAAEVDFFSIGTNDLCQYTLAADRMNERVAYLCNHFNPSVLKLISYTIEQAQMKGIHAGLCGEMAGDPLATSLLIGMGLKDFSMSSSSIPVIKNIIRKLSMGDAIKIWHEVREMTDTEEITGYLRKSAL